MSNAIHFHLVSLDLPRVDASLPLRSTAYYIVLSGGTLLRSSEYGIDNRPAEQMQSRRGNHSETWLRCVSTAASTLHRLRVEWWRHRCRRRRHRGKINSWDGHRRLPHQFHSARERDTRSTNQANARRSSVERSIRVYCQDTTRPRRRKTNLQIGPLGYA